MYQLRLHKDYQKMIVGLNRARFRNELMLKREEKGKERERKGKKGIQPFVFLLATVEIVFWMKRKKIKHSHCTVEKT